MTDQELMQQWMKRLSKSFAKADWTDVANVHNEIKVRLAQPEPQRKEWQGLTDEEIRNEAKNHVFDESFFSGAVWARGKIMGKNHG